MDIDFDLGTWRPFKDSNFHVFSKHVRCGKDWGIRRSPVEVASFIPSFTWFYTSKRWFSRRISKKPSTVYQQCWMLTGSNFQGQIFVASFPACKKTRRTVKSLWWQHTWRCVLKLREELEEKSWDFRWNTRRKLNSEFTPEKWWVGRGSLPFGMVHFQGRAVQLQVANLHEINNPVLYFWHRSWKWESSPDRGKTPPTKHNT